ncbi:unnamed protein product [Psylliodes chrysocephalus]|uniref:Trichohyalin-plectin-homology domain-containing protein n=1 Tax=Psylliodes chrysocephalus TaxID=3402493 RepID=A0A9P0D9V6_9CUCU|nr:unnamed protein product [Psylliodes chrysocephala]
MAAINYPSIHPGQYPYMGRNLPGRPKEVNSPRRRQPILCPTIHPGVYPHYGKEPNSGTLKMAYEEKFLKNNIKNMKVEDTRIEDDPDNMRFYTQVTNHVNYLQIQRDIKNKVAQKINAYEETVDKRREKLKDLFYAEERQYYQETVKLAFKGQEDTFEQMKRTLDIIKKKKEEERQQVVHRKRIEQYINLCQELKPALFKRHLIESKNAQLQQMRENEARRLQDKELDRMWYELNEKEQRAMKEREERETMAKKAVQLTIQETLAKQVRGKELLKAEEKKMKMEDQLEFERRNDEMRRKDIENLKKKRKEKEALLKDIKEQIRTQEEILRKHKEEDEEISKVYQEYNAIEIEKEKAARLAKIEQTRKEWATFKKYLQEVELHKKNEEKKLNELMTIFRKEIQKKHEEAECKIAAARMELHKSVIEGRAQQIEYKRQEAENQLKAQQAENELLQIAYELNIRLQEESDRVEMEAIQQYRDDLKDQIEYNNKLRERERQELERKLQKGREEEEKYKKLVQDIIKVHTETPYNKHPFRRALERHDCRCPAPL